MKKIALICAMIALICGVAMAHEPDAKSGKKDIIKDILDIVTRPAEDIIGHVVDLEKIIVSPDNQNPALAAINTVNVASSRERGTSPSSRAFSSRLDDGSSVFSASLSSAMKQS